MYMPFSSAYDYDEGLPWRRAGVAMETGREDGPRVSGCWCECMQGVSERRSVQGVDVQGEGVSGCWCECMQGVSERRSVQGVDVQGEGVSACRV
jgi:hypothetical protein